MIDYGLSVTLDTLKRGHLEKYRTWRNSDIRQVFRQTGLIDEVSQEKWFLSLDRKTTSLFEVLLSKELIGVAGLTSINLINRRAEISCYINPTLNKSLDDREILYKDAVLSVSAYGFLELGLNRVFAEVLSFNKLGLKTFEDLEFDREGFRLEYYYKCGCYHDAFLFSCKSTNFMCRFKKIISF